MYCLMPSCLQLYRVNVLLQSPDSLDLSSKPPFFVLRRYSQFRQLHTEVSASSNEAQLPEGDGYPVEASCGQRPAGG